MVSRVRTTWARRVDKDETTSPSAARPKKQQKSIVRRRWAYLLGDGFQYALDGFRVKDGHLDGGRADARGWPRRDGGARSSRAKNGKMSREPLCGRRWSRVRFDRYDDGTPGARSGERKRERERVGGERETRRCETNDLYYGERARTHGRTGHCQWTSEITIYRKRRPSS